jgi:ferredoxin
MGHLGSGKTDVFLALAGRLDKNPVGAPLNETLMRILHTMYTEREAAIASQFPPGFITLDKLVAATGLPADQLATDLDNMADKGLVVDMPRAERVLYALSPLVVGFFEYTFMRVTDKVPQPALAELFERYLNERGVAEAFFGADTKMFQAMAYESLMPADLTSEVLDYEKASAMIRSAGKGALSMCFCRHQAQHRGTACDAPVEDVCTSLGPAADWLIRRGFARPAGVDELLTILDRTEALGLVHIADNVKNNPAFICHCCGCCCMVLRGLNEHGLQSLHPSNFIVGVDDAACSGCGLCADRCHIKAIAVDSSAVAAVNVDHCLGCGVCVKNCPSEALSLVRRTEVRQPPRDRTELMLKIAKENKKI